MSEIRTVYVGHPEADRDQTGGWRYFFAVDVQERKGGRRIEIARGYFSKADGFSLRRSEVVSYAKRLFSADRVRRTR